MHVTWVFSQATESVSARGLAFFQTPQPPCDGERRSSGSRPDFLPRAGGGQTRFTAKSALVGSSFSFLFLGGSVGGLVSFSPGLPEGAHAQNTKDPSQLGVDRDPPQLPGGSHASWFISVGFLLS